MKLLLIIGVIVAWFIVGFIINFLFYVGKPMEQHGTSETARSVHILTNIITVIIILAILFG